MNTQLIGLAVVIAAAGVYSHEGAGLRAGTLAMLGFVLLMASCLKEEIK